MDPLQSTTRMRMRWEICHKKINQWHTTLAFTTLSLSDRYKISQKMDKESVPIQSISEIGGGVQQPWALPVAPQLQWISSFARTTSNPKCSWWYRIQFLYKHQQPQMKPSKINKEVTTVNITYDENDCCSWLSDILDDSCRKGWALWLIWVAIIQKKCN